MDAPVELINGWILPVLAAPAVGSFCGVVIRRLPEGRPIAAARSCCAACGHVLGPADMVPLVSWLAQRGRCRHCGAPIGTFHPAVELAALAVAGVAALVLPGGPELWLACALGWWLLTLAWIDAETMRLPDVLTLPLLLLGLGEAAWLAPGALFGRAVAAALGYGLLWGLAAGYKRLRHRDGLGMGDAKLLAAAGAWLGPFPLPEVMLFAAIAALGWAGVLSLRGVMLSGGLKLPLGPFLAAAFFAVWLAQ
jgi:leader peptidase (prepilin peptidase)/N-methyltransferase